MPFLYWTLWMSKRHRFTWIILILSTMIYSVIWIAVGNRKQRWRLNRCKIYSLTWSLGDRHGLKNMQKQFQQCVCIPFVQTLLIVSGSCDHWESHTCERILHLRTWCLIQLNSKCIIELCGAWKLCQILMVTWHDTRQSMKQKSRPLRIGIWILSILLWSIWDSEQWWRISNTWKCSWKYTRTKQLFSTIIDSYMISFEFNPWITKELSVS